MKKWMFSLFIISLPLLEGLEIDSSEVNYNGKSLTLKGQVTLEHEMGIVSADEATLISNREDYKSKDLTLLLKGNVKVQFNKGGTLTCPQAEVEYATLYGTFFGNEEEPVFYQDNDPDLSIRSDKMVAQIVQKKVSSISAMGRTTLRFVDKAGESHALSGEGTCLVDRIKEEMLFSKATEAPEGNQILFEDLYGRMNTDILYLKYGTQDEKICINKLILEGHVSLINRYQVSPATPKEMQQYALADKVEWIPSLHQLSLSAQSPSRVLFLDPLNHLQVSAPALTVRRDPKNQKDSIQGQGDVRFRFITPEFDKLKERFQILPEASQ